MVEEILQVHNNIKKRIYLSCVIMFVRVSIQSPKTVDTRERHSASEQKQWRNTLDEIKKTIEDKEREREEEAEVKKMKKKTKTTKPVMDAQKAKWRISLARLSAIEFEYWKIKQLSCPILCGVFQ
ncbi:hypothetical protein RFI_34156 [Reticulomyxa filosa]|uniref:Uncharacterized protein n=1 Tax=Reticulomyxa filosa TaxID=46433 RepID=X6LNQ7_RETFI|nr:hypothetical protein RFI_34156 [Reticulomyxa filosa]|eukprot:ETO03254.1 hypothetical protein RFI_34156 [Reticulomyxa filosa]